MLNSVKEADIMGVWYTLPMGDAYISSISGLESKYFTDACAVEPYGYDNPWSYELKEKKCLLFHHFQKK
jgi:hypothetical protein